jgi:hypothetical protein
MENGKIVEENGNNKKMMEEHRNGHKQMEENRNGNYNDFPTVTVVNSRSVKYLLTKLRNKDTQGKVNNLDIK